MVQAANSLEGREGVGGRYHFFSELTDPRRVATKTIFPFARIELGEDDEEESPHLRETLLALTLLSGESGAVEWAANYIKESLLIGSNADDQAEHEELGEEARAPGRFEDPGGNQLFIDGGQFFEHEDPNQRQNCRQVTKGAG